MGRRERAGGGCSDRAAVEHRHAHPQLAEHLHPAHLSHGMGVAFCGAAYVPAGTGANIKSHDFSRAFTSPSVLSATLEVDSVSTIIINIMISLILQMRKQRLKDLP